MEATSNYDSVILAASNGVSITVGLVFSVLMIIAMWKIFKKAGHHGWAAIVPVYNLYVLYKITWGSGLMFLLPGLLGIAGMVTLTMSLSMTGASMAILALFGLIAIIACGLVTIITQLKMAKVFGKGIGFAVGLILVNPIFMLILAFGGASYVGVSGKAKV